MIQTLGTKIAHQFECGELRSALSHTFLPESWRRQACIERGTHVVKMMYAGDWYCRECATYDEPCG